MRDASSVLEGRNAVLEALRAGVTVDRLFVQEKSADGPISTIVHQAKKQGIYIHFVKKQRLDEMSDTGRHQGVIAYISQYDYCEVSDILEAARKKEEDPFIIILDGITDPHNLGAIIRSANLVGAHGIITKKHGSAPLSAAAAKASAGAIAYTLVARVTNISNTIAELKKQGLWFACADASGSLMYDTDLKGPLGLVIGDEGRGVSELVKKNCDYIVQIPMKGDIDSLNASVACGVLCYEIYRQRMNLS